ncbi:hypothetical protein ACWKX9_21720 [Enterobacter asburiae]
MTTLIIINGLSRQVANMRPKNATVCKHLADRQDELLDYISVIKHTERLSV